MCFSCEHGDGNPGLSDTLIPRQHHTAQKGSRSHKNLQIPVSGIHASKLQFKSNTEIMQNRASCNELFMSLI